MIRPLVWIAGLVSLYTPLSIGAQTPNASDTTAVQPVEVLALRIPSTAAQAAANIQVLNVASLQNGHSPDLQDALNSIPGVFMETRGTGGSRRLQMRSSGLRSPFGVRNVLMLMDGFVLTNASGNSPLEMWNPQWLQRLEVVKGPVGALYGNAYGGALLATSLPTFQSAKTSTNWYTTLRSQGLGLMNEWAQESGISHTQNFRNSENRFLHFRAFWNDATGYRDQEYNYKNQAELHLLDEPSQNVKTHLWLGWMDANWGLPGSLNQEDATEDPTKAPGLNYKAHVQRSRTWLGWSRTVNKTTSRNGFWLYGQLTNKHNPFGTSPFFNGTKDESEEFISLRYWRAKSYLLGSKGKFTFDQSVIARYEWFDITERDNGLDSDDLRYDIAAFTQSHWAAVGGRLELGQRWQIDAQLALEHMQRESEGSSRKISSDSLSGYVESYSVLDPLPFIQASYLLVPGLRMFAQWGNGGSHPTTFELVDPEDYEPYNLKPEEANSYEFGIRWLKDLPSSAIELTAQAYHQRVNQAITRIPGSNDEPIMGNVDSLQMSGVELTVAARHTFKNGLKLAIQGWGNLNRHAFESYGNIFTLFTSVADRTNTLPGTPLHTAGTKGTLQKKDWTLGWQHQWLDKIKLHDDKEDWAQQQHRVNLYVQRDFKSHKVQIGVRNALNAEFSGWLQTNGFGGKYYNPAPPRTFWISLRWRLN